MQMYYYYSDQRGKKDKTATCFDLCKAIVFGKGGFLALDFRWPPPWKNKAKKIKFLKYKVNNILNFPFARRCFWTNTIPLSLWLCISFYIGLSEKPRLSWNNSSGRCLNSCRAGSPAMPVTHHFPSLCSHISHICLASSPMLSDTNYLFFPPKCLDK